MPIGGRHKHRGSGRRPLTLATIFLLSIPKIRFLLLATVGIFAHPTRQKASRFKLAFSVYRAYSARTMQCMRVGRLISQYHFVDMSLKVSIAQPCYRIRHKIARRNYALTHVPGMMPALSLKAIENIIWEFLWRAVPKSKVMKPRANIH
jgi:hypothetical protein